MKLRWTECGDKLTTLNGTLTYKIGHSYGAYFVQAGITNLGRHSTQLAAIKACQDYEDELDKKKE